MLAAEAEADLATELAAELAEPAAEEGELAPEEAATDEWVAVAVEPAAPADVCAIASAVALRVPHCSFVAHVAWPWASLGWLLMH